MKFAKLALQTVLLASTLVSSFASAASESSREVSTADIDSLIVTCAKDPNQFESRLGKIRDGLTTDFQKMTQSEYDSMLASNDKRLILAISTWPEIVKEKDELWKSYNECADSHLEARKALISSVSKEDKKEAVLALSDCLEDRFRQPVAPMKSLIACYRNQINKR